MAKIGIVTISDRAFNGIYEDKGGPAIHDWLENVISSNWQALRRLCPDEQSVIENELIQLVDVEGCSLIFTTGGTGPASRDVTPEATLVIADKVMDGFGERMRAISLKYVPTAILSRQIAVIRKRCLIINLPGQPRSIKETLDELFAAIPYCLELIGAETIETNPEILVSFKPKK
jgi:molybdopterin adenylyltransferase